MNDTAFTLEPRDLLFLRDARPMAASDAGQGANWPRPDQLWNALINAFHRQWPERQEWEGMAHTKRDGERRESSDRFGALKTCGPFPLDADGQLYLPCPLDSDMDLVPSSGTNLPIPLTHAFRRRKLGKESLPAWISADNYQRYLAGGELDPEKLKDSLLYSEERSIGIAINSETHATEDSKLYQAEYLRLRDGVRLAFCASCDLVPKGLGGTVDAFGKLGSPAALILGGQQGVATLRKHENALQLPTTTVASRFLRWTLLAPAVFPAINAHPGGWRPSWVDADTGQVMLPQGKLPEKSQFRSRDDWRRAVAACPKFSAKLVAARIGKPLAFSGWDLQTGPKPTQLAVPAGSSYVFECTDIAEAQALAIALNPPNRRSTLLGEKGFGLGLCSSINCH